MGLVWLLLGVIGWTVVAAFAAGVVLLISAAVVLVQLVTTRDASCGQAAAILLLAAVAVLALSGKLSKRRTEHLRRVEQAAKMVPAQTEDFRWLDRERLELWTADLRGMGFSELGDFTVQPAALLCPFLRVLASEDRSCFAVINQRAPRLMNGTDVACGFVSYFASGSSCQTTNAGVSLPESVRSMGLTIAAHPGAPPTDLLERHLEERQRVLLEESTTLVDDVSLASYLDQTAKFKNRMGAIAKRP